MESRLRTLLKTLSWRVIAAFVTGTLAYCVTGSAELGAALGTADTVVKLVLYYGHERAWQRVRIGVRAHPPEGSNSVSGEFEAAG